MQSRSFRASAGGRPGVAPFGDDVLRPPDRGRGVRGEDLARVVCGRGRDLYAWGPFQTVLLCRLEGKQAAHWTGFVDGKLGTDQMSVIQFFGTYEPSQVPFEPHPQQVISLLSIHRVLRRPFSWHA